MKQSAQGDIAFMPRCAGIMGGDIEDYYPSFTHIAGHTGSSQCSVQGVFPTCRLFFVFIVVSKALAVAIIYSRGEYL